MSYNPPPTVVMKGEISDIDQNPVLHQVINIRVSAVKLGILTWGGGGVVYETDSFGGQSMNCTFSHVRVGFTRERRRLLLGTDT